MNIGKLKGYSFVDIHLTEKKYTYAYFIYSKKFLKQLCFNLNFTSQYPYYLYLDIMKVMRNEGYFFEDLIDKKTFLSIGVVKVKRFSQNDIDNFSNNYKNWKLNYFAKALKKQNDYKASYDKKYGHPDDIGLHAAYKNIP